MREFKFRAWVREEDERYSHMVDSPRSIITILEHILMVGRPMGFSDCDSRPYPERYVLMQYTGLKDKNGKEIYEGDILKDTNNAIYYVDFIRGCFYLKTNYKSFPHLGWTEWLPMCEIDRLAIPVEFEIIGNIYENPELLEG